MAIIKDSTDKRIPRILKTIQLISLLAEIAKIEIQHDLTDTKFKNNRSLNNHVRNLKQAANSIQTEMSAFGKLKDREEFSYNYAIEMHRLISYFSMLTSEQIGQFMDNVETIPHEQRRESEPSSK